jgi:hypothetical protein
MEKEFFETGAMIPFKDFLHMARRYLSHIHVDEVAYALCRYLEPQNRVLESITADDLKDSDGSDGDATSEKKPSFDASLSGLLPRPAAERGGGFSSMKRGLSHTNSNSYGTREDFEQLPLSETDKKIIRKIISNMGEKNVFQLLLDKKDMEKMGKQIRNVHPLRFIGYILSESSLRRHLTTVSQSHFKWTGFMDGFKDRMKEEAKKGQLMPYLAGLCQLLNVAPSSVAGYIQRGDYEGFVKHFI